MFLHADSKRQTTEREHTKGGFQGLVAGDGGEMGGEILVKEYKYPLTKLTSLGIPYTAW